jgi:hypothetical protein
MILLGYDDRGSQAIHLQPIAGIKSFTPGDQRTQPMWWMRSLIRLPDACAGFVFGYDAFCELIAIDSSASTELYFGSDASIEINYVEFAEATLDIGTDAEAALDIEACEIL